MSDDSTRLHSKRILICGGATGIGAATARRLSEAQSRVVVADLNVDGAEALAAELTAAGGDVTAMAYDQADDGSIQAMVAAGVERLGGLDGVFANAADLNIIHSDGDLLNNDLATWQQTFAVNLTGTARIVSAALPHLLAAGAGSIVCTSSSASTVGEPERPAYAASKAGIEALCRHVASRWGEQGVRCNAVAPGFVLTEQIKQNMPQDMLDKMLRGVRSTRHGEPADIAATVAFLLSDDAAWINGQTWHVNGGVCFG